MTPEQRREVWEMLGLHPPAETITIEDKTTIDLDWVAHDIRNYRWRDDGIRPARG